MSAWRNHWRELRFLFVLFLASTAGCDRSGDVGPNDGAGVGGDRGLLDTGSTGGDGASVDIPLDVEAGRDQGSDIGLEPMPDQSSTTDMALPDRGPDLASPDALADSNIDTWSDAGQNNPCATSWSLWTCPPPADSICECSCSADNSYTVVCFNSYSSDYECRCMIDGVNLTPVPVWVFGPSDPCEAAERALLQCPFT